VNRLGPQVPACAILDVHMPASRALTQSRLRTEHIEVPVIFITASDDLALDRQSLEAGAVCLLRKPFSSSALLNAVGVALRQAV
jgi:FixJ family two-component response regulator